jgi:isopenicillin-N epimerase
MLEHWRLDPAITYLNHGTVGATPRRVLEKQQSLRDEMERQPSQFMLRELAGLMPAPWRRLPRIREASEHVARFLGAHPDDLAFVPNVTTGLNAVFRSVPLGPGDEVLITDLAYGAIGLAAGAIVRERGAALKTIPIPHPVTDAAFIVQTIASALTPSTKIAVVDHITSESALVLPVTEIAAECHARGVLLVVDGAHTPGSLALDIPATGADWYVANLHKWAHAPRACGILWASRERQAGLHSPVVSWNVGKGFREEFGWSGTGDPTSCLAAPEGLALLREWDFEAVLGYIHGLAWEGACLLAGRWGTKLETARALIGAMATVPLPEGAGATEADAARLRLALLLEDRIEVQLHAWHGRLWVRISAQVYNELSDVARLGDAVLRRLSAD